MTILVEQRERAAKEPLSHRISGISLVVMLEKEVSDLVSQREELEHLFQTKFSSQQ